tara:strand:- start:440 stop:775 length:336 start_codon:yes stop_codon:yes gene_type:complete
MSNTTLLNYSERQFVSKTEVELYIKKQDEIFTTAVVEKFQKAGMLRRVVTRVWNKEGRDAVGILFEYRDPDAFKQCQKLLEVEYITKIGDFNSKVVGSRGIVVHEFVSAEF